MGRFETPVGGDGVLRGDTSRGVSLFCPVLELVAKGWAKSLSPQLQKVGIAVPDSSSGVSLAVCVSNSPSFLLSSLSPSHCSFSFPFPQLSISPPSSNEQAKLCRSHPSDLAFSSPAFPFLLSPVNTRSGAGQAPHPMSEPTEHGTAISSTPSPSPFFLMVLPRPAGEEERSEPPHPR